MGEAKRKRVYRGSTRYCPKCGSPRVATDADMVVEGYGPGLATCVDCSCIWEYFDPAAIWDPTDPMCSFSEPCNNCAFRPGSSEQQDRDKWLALIDSLKDGASFYCHKGVPIEPGAEHGFAYPEKMVPVRLDGELVTTTKLPDRQKLRTCRGYLNALGGLYKARERRAAEEPAIDNDGLGLAQVK